MQKKATYTFFIFLIGFAFSTYATETKLIIRVKAKDAKFIGSSMGGALVVVRDSDTGQILAKGFTKGRTGNTKLIMYTTERGVALSDEATAKFDEIALEYARKTSTFQAEYPTEKPGVYEFIVYAYDANTGNTGVDRVSFVVGE